MNILLIYLKRKWSPPFYLEKVFRKNHQVEIFDFAKSPYRGDLRFNLPFYIPKGLLVSVQNVIKKFKKNFDLIIEVTTAGQYHLTHKVEMR